MWKINIHGMNAISAFRDKSTHGNESLLLKYFQHIFRIVSAFHDPFWFAEVFKRSTQKLQFKHSSLQAIL